MATTDFTTTLRRALVAGTCVGVSAYAAYAAVTWLQYGRPRRPVADESTDTALDRLMPDYDVVERHHIEVDAPAAVTLATACEMDITATPVARAIFRAREIVMGGSAEKHRRSGFVDDMRALGWGILADEPGHELVMGGVTKPWEPNPVFRAVPPDEFATFSEPNLVKIAFTLRADAITEARSIFRTETRAMATDSAARRRFRNYWSLLSPGIIMIRWAMLRPLKAAAERRAREHDQSAVACA